MKELPPTRPTSSSEAKIEAMFGKSVGYQIRLTQRVQESYLQSLLAERGLQIGMYYLLRILWLEDGVTQKTLSHRVGASEPATLEQLRKMQRRGLIERRRSRNDQRETNIFLTTRAKAMRRNALIRYVDDFNAACLRGFSKRQIADLHGYLSRVRANVRAAAAKRNGLR